MLSDYELHGPWLGNGQNPARRRAWLKHRHAWRCVLLLLVIVAGTGLLVALSKLHAERAFS